MMHMVTGIVYIYTSICSLNTIWPDCIIQYALIQYTDINI